MYKLLLVTDKQTVKEAFEQADFWDTLGFKAPRITGSADEAEQSLTRHHPDGIAVDLEPEDQEKLMELLASRYPLMPILKAEKKREDIRRDVQELYQLQNRLRADYSNDRYDAAESMQLCRHSFFRELLTGKVSDAEAMKRRLMMLRSRMNPDSPCVLIELIVPQDEHYISGHWRYGADRLEVAMRNIFGAELEGMRILVSVLPGDRLFLLACPMLGAHGPEMDSMTAIVSTHVENAIVHVQDYLNMNLSIGSVRVLTNLGELTRIVL